MTHISALGDQARRSMQDYLTALEAEILAVATRITSEPIADIQGSPDGVSVVWVEDKTSSGGQHILDYPKNTFDSDELNALTMRAFLAREALKTLVV